MLRMKSILLLGAMMVIVLSGVLGRPSTEDRDDQTTSKERKCGYEGCPKIQLNMLNVHMVPHTHDDVGWLKTVDQYYYGSETLIQKAGVQYIIDSFIQELINDPEKRFIYVESAFFSKWWKEQTPKLQEQVKELVNQGRLEFIGGAWSMNDEATAHYNSVIDQFTWGLKFLSDNFGQCARPKIGWQIDPFGHAREQASLYAQMGYDGMFFGRLDYQDKQNRLATKSMEMIWHASDDLGDSSDIFTGVLHNLYQPPPGFCFDILCADEPMIDDPESPDYNVDRRVDEFFTYITEQAKNYRTNNIIMTMGGDFTYMDANVYYKNMDKLIKYANDRQQHGSNITLFYSTPSCYLKALHDSEITWPEKSDDFFPYASDIHSFWTGYYTSRPTQKHFERMGNSFLQVCKQMSSFAINHKDEFVSNLNKLREIMGIMQHHDAITGTEKQKVANDYAKMINDGIAACAENTMQVLNQWTTRNTNGSELDPLPFEYKPCLQLNISSCDVSEKSEKFIVTVYNPLAHLVFEYITVPVLAGKYLVKDYRDVEIKHQMSSIPKTILNLDMRKSEATHHLTFHAPEVPALGYKSFFITKLDNIEENLEKANSPAGERVTIGNKFFDLNFDEQGFLDSVSTVNGDTFELTQNFIYYEGAMGNNYIPANRSSGAYIFRPNNTEKFITQRVEIEVIRGNHVQEVRQKFNEWVSQIIRVYQENDYIEFDWMVGPIPINDEIGKEVVSRFYSKIRNNDTFYTDSNGRQMIKRVRNHRDTWNIQIEEKVAGNYYPITTKMILEDHESRLAILTDRAQGGGSMFDGSLEIMVHRRLLRDDAFGVGEALNETENGKGLIAKGTHWVIIGKKHDDGKFSIEAKERFLQNEKLLPSWLFFSDASHLTYTEWTQKYSNIHSAMSLAIPKNVHLLTWEPWDQDKLLGSSYLVRFEHILENGEDTEYSKNVTFNMQDHFRYFDISWMRETTLGGNQWLEDMKRLKFEPVSTAPISVQKTIEQSLIKNNLADTENSSNLIEIKSNDEESIRAKRDLRSLAFDKTVVIKPMEIRTFVVKMNPDIYDK